MIVTGPTQPSLPDLGELCVRRLPRPGRGVKDHPQPRPALTRHFTPKPRRIRTYTKTTPNLFRMSTFKTQDLKLFRICRYPRIPSLPNTSSFFQIRQTSNEQQRPQLHSFPALASRFSGYSGAGGSPLAPELDFLNAFPGGSSLLRYFFTSSRHCFVSSGCLLFS